MDCIRVRKIGRIIKIGNTYGRIIISCYVDDLLIGVSKNALEQWKIDKSKLASIYKIKDIGLCQWILNMAVEQNQDVDGTISVSQEKYINEIVEKYEMTNANVCATPSVVNPLTKLQIDSAVPLSKKDHETYRSIVGACSYAAITTRIDIAYAVNKCAQALASPTTNDMIAIKRVVRYLKGTSKYKLVFGKNGLIVIVIPIGVVQVIIWIVKVQVVLLLMC